MSLYFVQLALFVDKISLSVDIICLNLYFTLPLHHSFKTAY